MAAKFKKGSAVRKVVPDIVGNIISAKLNEETLGIRYLVEYEDPIHGMQQRFFEEDELVAEVDKKED